MLGGVDLCVELGCHFAWEPLLMARARLVAAAASAGLLTIDVPWLDVADSEGARAESARVAALGFAAKAVIHPSQVTPVHSGLAPAPEALARAQRIVAAAGADDAAVLLDGRLIDRPVVLAAAQLLRRAGL
jgi:(S)-citramalyl-CoA lyase